VLRESNVGGSNTESLINHLKSKYRIHVILESEDHKTIPEQEEIRSQIVKKEMSLFEATRNRSNTLKKLFHATHQAPIVWKLAQVQAAGPRC